MMYLFGPSGLMMEFRPPFLRRGRRSRIRNARRTESCQMIRREFRILIVYKIEGRKIYYLIVRELPWRVGQQYFFFANRSRGNEFAFSPPSRTLPFHSSCCDVRCHRRQKKERKKKRGASHQAPFKKPQEMSDSFSPCLNLSLHLRRTPQKKLSMVWIRFFPLSSGQEPFTQFSSSFPSPPPLAFCHHKTFERQFPNPPLPQPQISDGGGR